MKFPFRFFALGFLIIAEGIQSHQIAVAVRTTSNDVIPFQLGSEFLIVLEGQIGPLTGLVFILDTGATHTMVDDSIADKLLLPRHKGKILNFDKRITVDWTNLPELHLGPLAAHDFPVMVGDLKRVSEFAKGADVILGLDFLRTAQSIRIDYRSRLVTIRTPAEGSANFLNGNALIVLIPLQGRPARLIVDTGLQSLLLYKDRLRRHLPELELSGPISQAYAGRLKCESAVLTGIRLGADELQSSVLLLPRAPASLPGEIDGYIGTNLLHAQMIELNFASKTLRWQ
jgi:predicted aspartyl protease